MIYDYNLRTIVMMNTLDSKDPVGCEMHCGGVIAEGGVDWTNYHLKNPLPLEKNENTDENN